jgi:NAD(P)-dependent dehydrogenase (short-subunit alcohol dehydrogenase family)
MIKNKIIVITGGAGLLGKAFSRNIAANDGIVIIADINEGLAQNLADEICLKNPGKAEAHKLDISKKDSILCLINYAQKKYGRIDAVINSAYPRNSNYGCKLEDVTYESFSENINMHLGGYFLVSQQFGIFFKSQKAGNIINLGSIYGSIAPRFELYKNTSMTMPVEYACIKSSIIHLTRYFAQYFKGENIRVNCISPGGIFDNQPSEFTKAYESHCNQKGMLDANDIFGTLLFLLSDSSKYITGQDIIVDDGFSL